MATDGRRVVLITYRNRTEYDMFTKIECGECGGDYRPLIDVQSIAHNLFRCVECSHEVAPSDLLPNMEEGEMLTLSHGVLGYDTYVVGEA